MTGFVHAGSMSHTLSHLFSRARRMCRGKKHATCVTYMYMSVYSAAVHAD